MKIIMIITLALLFSLAVSVGEEARPMLILHAKMVSQKSVRVRGDEPNVNVMFNFVGDPPKEIVKFERANFTKWIKVTVDGELVSEKALISGITGGNKEKVVALDLIFRSKKQAERAAKLLRGGK